MAQQQAASNRNPLLSNNESNQPSAPQAFHFQPQPQVASHGSDGANIIGNQHEVDEAEAEHHLRSHQDFKQTSRRLFGDVSMNPQQSFTPTQYKMGARAKARHNAKLPVLGKLLSDSLARQQKENHASASEAMQWHHR